MVKGIAKLLTLCRRLMDDLTAKMALIFQELGMSENTISQVIKTIVLELALEGPELGLSWKMLVQENALEEFGFVKLESFSAWQPTDN